MKAAGYWTSHVKNWVARRFGLNSDIDRTTCKVEVLYPERHYDHKPALYLPEELEKITAGAFNRPIETEVRSLKGKALYSNTLARLEIKNAYLSPKFVLSGKLRKSFYHRAPTRFSGPFRTRERGALASSHVGCNFFGHWLGDDCATYLLASEEADAAPLIMPTPAWAEQAEYAALFDQDWTPTPPTLCRHLSFYIDHGQNPHKAARFRKMRQTLRNHARAKGARNSSADIVYIKRGPMSSSRTLINEDEITGFVQSIGGYIHEAESGLDKLTKFGLDARIVIGVEGSQLCHAIYSMRDQGGLLVIQPHDRFFTSHLDWCRELDMEFAFMVGTRDQEGFSVDMDAFQRTLALLDKAVR